MLNREDRGSEKRKFRIHHGYEVTKCVGRTENLRPIKPVSMHGNGSGSALKKRWYPATACKQGRTH